MFEIRTGDLPFIQTGRALLALDLQNDLVTKGCALPVSMPEDLVEKTIRLAQAFRPTGKIFWIRTQFEGNRTINDGHPDSENIITDEQLRQRPKKHIRGRTPPRNPSSKLEGMYKEITELGDGKGENEFDDKGIEKSNGTNANGGSARPFDGEAFLTLSEGDKPQFALPMLSGVNFAQPIISILDSAKDTMLSKSHYSAFRSGQLIQALRGCFVTELYICGALTNISVYATAMDAARYGYSIILMEDCLGYRSKARHDEALRQLVEATGCELKSSSEVIDGIQKAAESCDTKSILERGGRDIRNLSQMIRSMRLDHRGSSDKQKDTAFESPDLAPKDILVPSEMMKVDHEADDESLYSHPIIEKPQTKVTSTPSGSNDKVRRVPNKIKTRQRSAKPPSNESSTNPAMIDVNTLNKTRSTQSTSPTQVRLAGATDVLEKSSEPAMATEDRAKSSSTLKAESEDTGEDNGEDNSGGETAERMLAKARAHMAVMKASVGISAKKEKRESKQKDIACEHVESEGQAAICEGDTQVFADLLPDGENIFYTVRDEVRWQKMSHQGGEVPRLVAVQGEIARDGSKPIYRHPADESPKLVPFSPAIFNIKNEVEKRLGHKVNHCLIQFYRDGTDYISEHSDKTLDIAPGTFIANVSLGAMRTMTFRTKKHPGEKATTNQEPTPRTVCKAPLPHNSMCKMGLITNKKWLHGIRPDKRRASERSEKECAFGGSRISITFRLIKTFLSRDQTHIWGQGAVAKHQYDARPVINGETPESECMLRAFGKENRDSHFDWEETYGGGFDVLHISNKRKLFLSGDPVTDMTIKLFLAEWDVSWSVSNLSPPFRWEADSPTASLTPTPAIWPIVLTDNDLARSTIEGEIAISFYLEGFYGRGATVHDFTQAFLARRFTRNHESRKLLAEWRREPFDIKAFRWMLRMWDDYASEDFFIAGSVPTGADYSIWPVLHEIVKEWGVDGLGLKNLASYYERMKQRPAFVEVLSAGQPVV